MTRTSRIRIAATVLAAASFAACGGSDDDTGEPSADATSTTVADGDATSTTKGSGVPGLGALQTFTISWNGTDTIGGNTVEGWVNSPIDGEAIVQQASEAGGEVFAVRLNDGAVLGGRIEDGEVTSVFVGVDPDNQATASVVQTAFLEHVENEDDILQVAQTYRDVALASDVRSEYVQVGEDDAFVISLIEGAEAGDRLVAVSMSDLTDEAAARERATLDQTEVLTLLAGAE